MSFNKLGNYFDNSACLGNVNMTALPLSKFARLSYDT